MNYGKKSVSKKRNSLISRTAMMGKRAHVSLIRVLFVALITICVVIGCTGIGAFRGIIDNAPDANDIDISPLGYATFLYDGDGNQLRKLTAPSSNRLPVSIDQIPLDLQHAVVAIEDERFYEHNGIDVRGILRAFVKNITSGDLSEGATAGEQPQAHTEPDLRFSSEGIDFLPRVRLPFGGTQPKKRQGRGCAVLRLPDLPALYQSGCLYLSFHQGEDGH